MQQPTSYISDLEVIAARAAENEVVNDDFLHYIHSRADAGCDAMAHAAYDRVSKAIDCTQCGNCCRSLVINVTQEEVGMLARRLQLPEQETKDKYIEESMQGNCYINTMPCHFLSDNKCTIYESRFKECRDFPHLHKPGFSDRLSGTLMHYHRCPIIYNVIEEMKEATGFNVRNSD